MADNDLVIASTTDSEKDIKAALEPREDTTPVLTEVDRATGQPIAPPAEEVPPTEEPAAPAETKETPPVAATPPEEEKKPPEPRKKPSRSEERINELTREKYLAQRRADRLEAELTAIKAAPVQPPSPPAQQPQPPPPQPDDSRPPTRVDEPKPQVAQFAVYEDFVDALTRWNARQVAAEQIAALRAEDAMAVVAQQQQDILSQFEAAKGQARERYTDFDEVMTSDVAIAMPLTESMQHIITTSPVGHDVAYYLVQHPDEAQQIAQLAPLDALRTLGRLEERVNFAIYRSGGGNGRAGAAPSPAIQARVTTAPPPVEPVGGHATTTSLPDDQLDYQAYKAKRNQEEMARRKARR